MTHARHTLNELLVGLFNYILYIEEVNLKAQGVKLSMTEVHLLESIHKASDNTMSHIARRTMVTQGTLTTSVKKLVAKGYVERYKDENDGRIVRLRLTEKASEVLAIHDGFHDTLIDNMLDNLNLDENQVLIDSLSNVLAYFRDEYNKHSDIDGE